MTQAPRPRPELRRAPEAHGVIFAVVMALAAYIGRDNPDFDVPQVFWAFLAFLLFGFLSLSYFSRRLKPRRWYLLYVGANIVLVSAIILYSGKSESYFWVMYLLPIFSATLSFDSWGVAAAAAACCAALAGFYALSAAVWPGIFELLIKAATLAAAAVVTASAAFGQRRAQELLEGEREKAGRERLAFRDQLQHMDRLATVGTLTASITHELNNPVAVILGYAEVVKAGIIEPGKREFCVERIRSAALRCRQVIDDTLAFARQQGTEKKLADVNALVHKCVELKRHDWISSGIEAEEAYAADLPRAALSASEFQQVIFNLLTNAEQAIGSKAEPSGRIRVSTRGEDSRIKVLIEDDGPGIPPEILGRIWEPFFTTKPVGLGTGLGLAICRRIIEQHGGGLDVESEPGRGALFVIELPQAAP